MIPAGAQALGLKTNVFNFQPQLSDISYSNTGTTKLYSGIWEYGTIPNSSHYTTSNGFLTILLNGNDGVTTVNLATAMNNSVAGTLPLLTAANGFYAEWTARLTSYTSDAHMALWLMPVEHDPTGTLDILSVPPAPTGTTAFEGWGELDCVESSFGAYEQALCTIHDHRGIYSALPAVASSAQNTGNGIFTTAAQSFTAGTMVSFKTTAPGGFQLGVPYFVLASNLSSTTCQLSVAQGGTVFLPTSSVACTLTPGFIDNQYTNTNLTPLIDYTQTHRYGLSYDPNGKMISMYVDDVLYQQHPTGGAPSNDLVSPGSRGNYDFVINPYHYFMIMSCFSRGANTPYGMEIHNISAWTP